MDDGILRYIEPVYRFCLKRVPSHADAEDLSQEILFCVLQGCRNTSVENMDGYVWRIAHNRYAKMMDAKRRDRTFLCGDEYWLDVPDKAAEDRDEEYQTVFRALHTLSAMYREILVDFYVRNLDVRAISERHAISAETVKWRLHTGREKIRERMTDMEKTYEKIKMHVMCNGSFGPGQYLGTQLYKAIAKTCYPSPRTIEEISLATGVPTLYLEEALEHMLWGDALEQTGQKYAANFIITSSGQHAAMREFLSDSAVKKISDAVWGYVKESEGRLRAIGFYGSDFPTSRLLYILVPAVLYAAAERMRETTTLLPKQRPQRKDGGSGWFIVTEGLEDLDENYSGCNGYFYDSEGGQPGRFLYYWTGDTFDGGLNETLHHARFFIDSMGSGYAHAFTDDADAAKAIACGLCENRSGRIYPAIPIFTEKQYADFSEWAQGCHAVDAIWQQWIESLFHVYRAFTPKRLANQIGGNVDSYSFNLSAFVLQDMRRRKRADVPEADKVFTKNLLLIRG